jgi:hypothetical protein
LATPAATGAVGSVASGASGGGASSGKSGRQAARDRSRVCSAGLQTTFSMSTLTRLGSVLTCAPSSSAGLLSFDAEGPAAAARSRARHCPFLMQAPRTSIIAFTPPQVVFGAPGRRPRSRHMHAEAARCVESASHEPPGCKRRPGSALSHPRNAEIGTSGFSRPCAAAATGSSVCYSRWGRT